MATIIIQLKARNTRQGQLSPKNYPYISELIAKLRMEGHCLIQVGSGQEEALEGVNEAFLGHHLKEVEQRVLQADTFISIDSFLPHMANYLGKRGVVIWGRGDYHVFGYMRNINLIKDEKNIRPDRFGFWDSITVTPDMFVKPDVIVSAIRMILQTGREV